VSEVNWQQEARHLIEEIEILKGQIYQQQNILNELEHLRRSNYWQEKIQFAPKSSSKAVIGRTCEEIYAQDATLPSGNYFIDPDGPDGDEPFSVYCNMTDSKSVHFYTL
jgi:Fibrillar collagen C-terminal domain